MDVQWCVKGLSLTDDATAREIIQSGQGLLCNWWRSSNIIRPSEVRDKLTEANLDLHVNHFGLTNPSTGQCVGDETPFISMSAGTVERRVAARTNVVHRARRTALWFGTNFGQAPVAYLYICWVVVAPRQAVEVEAVAEKVRDLNVYRAYSDYQTEGEIVAKIYVPANQIQRLEKWEWEQDGPSMARTEVFENPNFAAPTVLSNVMELI